jgi:hypothetical protein
MTHTAIRRTAKITTGNTTATIAIAKPATPSRPAKKATSVYKGVVLIRVYSKETGAVLGYAAKPSQPIDSLGNVKPWHRLICDEYGEWHCDCDGNAVWHRQCKHIRAVSEVCGIRAEQGRPANKPVASMSVEETATQPAVETSVMEVKMSGDVAGWRPVQRQLPDGQWYPMGIYASGQPIEFSEADHALAFIAATTDEQRREVIIAAKRAEQARSTPRLTQVLKKRDADAAPLNGNRGFSLMR